MKNKIMKVCAADEIQQKLQTPPFGFITNTDPHQLPGRHWVACYVDENNILEIFDSYGNSPDALSPYITRYMNLFERTLFNHKRLQSSKTKVCGQYCLFYLMCRCRNYSQKEVIDIFNDDFERNDQFVYDFIEQRFHCCIHNTSVFNQICKCINKL
ncbi:unnamed protein product [Mytilus coruscus]|uniref:Ubiquitin-like protease family profile domain-containing protein n=1 Tax=Mytilus coruscus TaxID=42192 RepID=A0A6J8E8T5_MYTCO|nr:unnamed protein product [Mytilus coruscus]